VGIKEQNKRFVKFSGIDESFFKFKYPEALIGRTWGRIRRDGLYIFHGFHLMMKTYQVGKTNYIKLIITTEIHTKKPSRCDFPVTC
jgi:hypothetical protein